MPSKTEKKSVSVLRTVVWYIAALLLGAVAIFAGWLSFSTNREAGWGTVPAACFAIIAAVFNVGYIASHYIHRADLLAALRAARTPIPVPAPVVPV